MFDILAVAVTFFGTLIAAVIIQWLVFLFSRPSNLPPGPLPLPIIGNIWVFFGHEATTVFKQLNVKYGSCVSLYSGCTSRGLIIMVFDWEMITEIAVNRPNVEIVADRPLDFSKQRGVKEGILWAQFDVARHRRRLFMRGFKDFGLASTSKTPAHVGDEMATLHAAVKRNIDQPFNPGKDITEAVASCVLMCVYSQRYDQSDINTAKIIAGGRAFFEGNFFELLFMPYTALLKHVLADNSAAGEREMEFHMSNLLEAEMERRKLTFNREHISDLLDAYMATDQNGALEFEGFMRSCVDIFLGAMETTSTALAWSLYFLAHMPDEQDRLFQEIDSVVSGSEFPSVEHRSQLIRLDAFILETLRYSSMVSFSLTRRCSDNVHFGQGDRFQVGANTNFIFIWYTCHFDAEYWLDPDNFRVDRWLDPKKPGQLIAHTHMQPFGAGKRVCPGETVARNLLFIFLGAFVQRFKWRLAHFCPFDSSHVNLARMPPEHKLIFTERE